jgi:predicted short-subunit dehydrogenase-like oxidoreductase (DUF2520 family)
MPLKSDLELKVGFIGAGTVGTALAIKLSECGYSVVAISDTNAGAAARFTHVVSSSHIYPNNQEIADNVDIVFITTPDSVIPVVASSLRWQTGQSVIHCSGADSTDTLEPAKQQGAYVGAFHPLQTFASVTKAIENIPGSTFAIEAEEPLLSTLKDMVAALKCSWVIIEAKDKAAYHAAAVFVSNYLVTLVKLGTDLWKTFNVPPDRATAAMIPLLKGTLNNIANIGIPDCLTGPVARGDIGTVQKHLDTLGKRTPDMVSTYRELGLKTIPIALAKGKIDELKAEELKEILRSPIHSSEGGRQCA